MTPASLWCVERGTALSDRLLLKLLSPNMRELHAASWTRPTIPNDHEEWTRFLMFHASGNLNQSESVSDELKYIIYKISNSSLKRVNYERTVSHIYLSGPSSSQRAVFGHFEDPEATDSYGWSSLSLWCSVLSRVWDETAVQTQSFVLNPKLPLRTDADLPTITYNHIQKSSKVWKELCLLMLKGTLVVLWDSLLPSRWKTILQFLKIISMSMSNSWSVSWRFYSFWCFCLMKS